MKYYFRTRSLSNFARSARFISLLLILPFIIPNGISAQVKSTAVSPLYVNPASRDFTQNPDLLERILSSAHGYFRFINIPFSGEICRRFRQTYEGAPSFNLHGDAHLEQYAVTDIGRGLTDFDDSSAGPAILDLMRFGVSLNLACRENSWEEDAPALFDKFLLGYRSALENPSFEAPEPSIVREMRKGFKHDRDAYFKWIESIMQPIPPAEAEELIIAMRPYVEAMYAENPEFDSDYLKAESVGYLKMGIGSALDLKYLMRCGGESADSLDDVVLEIKEVRDLSDIECLTIAQKTDPFRVLIGQARIAYQPFRLLGYFRFRGKNLWVHSWVENYREIKITESFSDVNQLEEVVFDIGVQLGRGHPRQIADPLDLQLRKAQIRWLNLYDLKIKRFCETMANEVVTAWQQFSENYSSR